MPASRSEGSPGFDRLDARIQRWIWAQGWNGLRDAQERAIPALIQGDRDVIIAAATAAGKTEAAFLPILSNIAQRDDSSLVVYISPLIALINDQWGRLTSLCEDLDVLVTPWHGDSSQSKKAAFRKDPRGVLLITPESIEAMFVRRGSEVRRIFRCIRYIVIDEEHAFIGSERGKQLQSLMRRIDLAAGRQVPRVGLSATLGDMRIAAEFLRPGAGANVTIIESTANTRNLRVQIRGYIQPSGPTSAARAAAKELTAGHIADHLFKTLRGSNNLLFPNSRSRVEYYADLLRERCEAMGLPNEFWPHHGSLAREMREETERQLKKGDRPATAVCTTTLELGVDIGSVKSVAQVGPPPSVASLQQRLGRSGRRPGEDSILRTYCAEQEWDPKLGISGKLRESLLQSIASVTLLLQKWFEPPVAGLHYSTLVQQILSVIAERGGARADEAYRILVKDGAFMGLPPKDFADILREMAENDLVIQESSGILLAGAKGEQLINSRDFYAAFKSPEEWRLIKDGKPLGTLPLESPVWEGLTLVFSGRRWMITGINTTAKTLTVRADRTGAPPIFDSGRPAVHDRVRRQMHAILSDDAPIAFLDSEASRLLEEARTFFKEGDLVLPQIIPTLDGCCILTWLGDRANEALTLMLKQSGIEKVANEGLVIESAAPAELIRKKLAQISAMGEIEFSDLLSGVENIGNGKWDWTLPSELVLRSYAASSLDISGALRMATMLTSVPNG